ncbi:MAG: hypothetical protein AABZ30_10570 [Myxococcota bacterium]
MIVLHMMIEQEGDHFVARCRELRTMTSGKTLAATFERAWNMARAYFAACEKKGTLDQVLARLAVGKMTQGRNAKKLPVRTDFCFQQKRQLAV